MDHPAPPRNSARTPFGRLPSLTHQIKELIHNYPEGIGIVKELLQNADAGDVAEPKGGVRNVIPGIGRYT